MVRYAGDVKKEWFRRKWFRKNSSERKGAVYMNYRKIVTMLFAGCLCVQSCMLSYAAVASSESDIQGIGPGFASQKIENAGTPWTRLNGVYVDDAGNPIEGALLRGVSVSKWQGDVNWRKAAADDISFALVRMASIGYEGEYTMDEYFDKNMREASDNGIHVTPYVYLQTRTVEESKNAAKFAVGVAEKYQVSYPLAVDVESQYIMDLSVQELTDIVNAFCHVVAEAGYTPIVYSDYSKFTTKMDTSQIPYDIWLARYGGDNRYPNRTMWQATDKGVVDGISGNVCLEFAFKDYGSSQASASDITPGEWKEESGIWYFEENGNRYTGWIKPDGNWYYLDPAKGGAMVSNTSMIIDGVEYSFNSSGVMQ